jgi:hypothetical protein
VWGSNDGHVEGYSQRCGQRCHHRKDADEAFFATN